MKTHENTTLAIKEHDFQAAKNSLKKYAAKSSSELSLPSVPISGRLFNLGEHKVTGNELNSVTSLIQGYFIDINKLAQNFIDEFSQVYKAFESLDKDYFSCIVGAINAIEKVSIDEQKDRAEIKKVVEQLGKSVEVLNKFHEDIEAEKGALQETVVLLKQKLKTAYIVAGSAAAFALIHFILDVVGVI